MSGIGSSEFSLIPLKPRKYDGLVAAIEGLLHAISTDAAVQTNATTVKVERLAKSVPVLLGGRASFRFAVR